MDNLQIVREFLQKIEVSKVIVTFKERYFEKYDKLLFNGSLWKVISKPSKTEDGFETVLLPLENSFGIFDSVETPELSEQEIKRVKDLFKKYRIPDSI